MLNQILHKIRSSLSFLFSLLIFLVLSSLANASSSDSVYLKRIKKSLVKKGIPSKSLDASLKAYEQVKAQGKVKKPIMTLVDFDLASNKKRLWVINMENGELLFNGYVARGNINHSSPFSNIPGSNASSLGAMVTGNGYLGKHGFSVRIYGLEKGINNNVYYRGIVLHPASYVSESFIKTQNRSGRSHGCFAIEPKYAPYVLNLVKNGSFLFAYATQKNYPLHLSYSS